jgi:hypothetical protein
MPPILQKTLGGLSPGYYFRQLFFSLMILAVCVSVASQGAQPTSVRTWLFFAVNSLLYPYSRFVYESVVSFIVGDHIFIVDAVPMLAAKLMTMLLCWVGAVVVAPIGLVFLYFHHSKSE